MFPQRPENRKRRYEKVRAWISCELSGATHIDSICTLPDDHYAIGRDPTTKELLHGKYLLAPHDSIIYFKNGLRHRPDGPAIFFHKFEYLYWHINGNPIEEFDGLLYEELTELQLKKLAIYRLKYEK